jgi:uncharacterized protein (TIGR00369 family)
MVTPEEINAFLEQAFPGATGRCEELGEGWAIACLDTSGVNLRPGGIVPGPIVFGLCDAALWYACFTVIGIEPMALTSELSIRYLTPARGAQVRARADLVKVGRRSIVGDVRVWTDDPAKPVAVAQGTYVPPPR